MVTPAASLTTNLLVQDREPTGEVRSVTLLTTADGSLRIRETTAGELTEAIFGCPSRYHEVSISREGVRTLERMHPSRPASAVLEGFFGSGIAYLTDLMDELDGLGIAYAYVSYLPTGDVYFRPPDTH